ncbi:MAG: response regulator [Polyangiales bacterium]
MPQQPHDTALGLARQRFVDSLPAKSGELRGALALLVGSPEAARPRDDFRARLQALYASAQVFRMHGLASALSDGAGMLERAREEARPVSQSELDELTHLVATLPSLVEGANAGVRPSMVPAPGASRPSSAPIPAVHVGSAPPAASPSPASSPSARPAARPARAHKPTMMGFQPPGLKAPAPPGSGSNRPPPPGAPPGSPLSGRPSPAPLPSIPSSATTRAAARPASTPSVLAAPRVPQSAAPLPPPPQRPPAAPRAPQVTPGPATRPAAAAPSPRPAVATHTAAPSVPRPAPAVRTEPAPRTKPEPAPVASHEARLVPMKPPAPFTTASPATVGAPRASVPPPESTTSAGGYSAPQRSIVSALICTDADSETLIRAALPAEQFEVLVAANAEEATQLAWASAPDLILADATVCIGTNGLLARLRRDALTDFVPVVVLFQPGVPVDTIALREAGAVDSLRKPLHVKTILQTVHRVADLGEAATWAPLGDLTVNDVAERIAEEIRRGLVLSADRGPDVAVPLGDGSEVLAAAWAAIARVRAHLSERSSGRVHFRDPAGRRGPALVSLNDLEPTAEEEARESSIEAEISLRGRRVIVADDDPAVRWFFAQLLEDEGAHVVQAEDGTVALAAARAHPPDAIVSDILMPNMDGLALCRALSRDPSVSETPVILLSWREDFLSRMRELRAGARGYLRKEAESTQILAKVRDVLRPRAQFEARLRAGGTVRGRVEGLGIPCLLATIQREREHALLTVRDAFNLFEVELRGREIVSVSCTATDGGFSRGDRALRVLVGVSTGRFAIEELDGDVRHSMAGGAPRVSVADACARLGALIDSVSGEALASVDSLGLDEDALDSFEATAPGEVGAVAAALGRGQTPRELLVGSVHAPQTVEAALLELARRGVILGVRDHHGVDLVATSLSEQEELLSASPAMDEAGGLPADALALDDALADRLDDLDREDADDAAPLLLMPAARVSHASVADALHAANDDGAEPLPLGAPVTQAAPMSPPVTADDAFDPLHDGSLELALGAPPAAAYVPAELAVDADTDEEPVRQGLGPLTWFAMLFMLMAVGYVGYMMVAESNASDAPVPDVPTSAPEAGEDHEGPSDDPGADEDAPDTDAIEDPSEGAPEPAGDDEPREDGLTFGTVTEGARLEGGRVPDGHGVLHILAGRTPNVVVSLGDQTLGPPPQQVSLPEGRHIVNFRIGETTVQRFYFVPGGHTRVVPVPEI